MKLFKKIMFVFLALYATVNAEDNGLFNGVGLEAPFTNFLDTVKHHVGWSKLFALLLPLDFLVKDVYDNTRLMKKLQSRVLVMTTESDRLIPPQQAKDFFAMASAPKNLVVYQSDSHENLYYLRNYREILA